jgi:hypothetical protein
MRQKVVEIDIGVSMKHFDHLLVKFIFFWKEKDLLCNEIEKEKKDLSGL